MVEDAAPQSTNQLEKGLYVLYKCSLASTSTSGHCGQSGVSLSLSHSSTPTPTTPTSPDHSNLSYPSSSGGGGGGSGGGGEGSVAVRFRLGKIVEYKEKLKSFLIQPVCLSTISGVGGGVMNGGSGVGGDVITSSDLISAEWVKRPNLRLITPPWYAEFKNELGLKPGRDVHINMLVHTQPLQPLPLTHPPTPTLPPQSPIPPPPLIVSMPTLHPQHIHRIQQSSIQSLMQVDPSG